MNPEQKFALLRTVHEARKTRAAETEAALLKENAALTQAIDQILARNGGVETTMGITPAPDQTAGVQP